MPKTGGTEDPRPPRVTVKMLEDLRTILRQYPGGPQNPALALENELLKSQLTQAGHKQVAGDRIEQGFIELERDRLILFRRGFMYCKGAKHLSKMYSLLSAHFVHGFLMTPTRSEELSCEFVDRATPEEVHYQYGIIQSLMAMIYMEFVECISEEDFLDEHNGPTVMAS